MWKLHRKLCWLNRSIEAANANEAGFSFSCRFFSWLDINFWPVKFPQLICIRHLATIAGRETIVSHSISFSWPVKHSMYIVHCCLNCVTPWVWAILEVLRQILGWYQSQRQIWPREFVDRAKTSMRHHLSVNKRSKLVGRWEKEVPEQFP